MVAGSSESSSTNIGEANTSFADAFESQIAHRLGALSQGKIVEGNVTGIGKDYVTVDIGYKTEGIVPVQQFRNSEGKLTVKVGDVTDVFIAFLENEQGQLVLSRERAHQKKVWAEVEKLFAENGSVSGRVIQKVKGGLEVDIGIPAFLPGSQVDIRPHRNLDRFIGEHFDFKVLKVTRDKGNIVLSRRAVLMGERDNLRKETLKVLSEGIVMEGVVKNITDYGAFIDLGGIDGLLHITDISWGRINHPSDKLSVGQSVPVVVLKYDGDKERVSLGMKQLKDDPWSNVGDRFPVNSTVKGRVVNVADYGAFVEIEDGVEGLIHVSEMTWNKKVRSPSKLVSQGDVVEAVVLGIDAEQRRVSLGMKQLMPNPWKDLAERIPVGSKVKGKIRTIADFGIFVGIEEGIDGLVHISDFSWTRRIKDPKEIAELYAKGDEVEAMVLGIDVDNERLSLGVKQLDSDPWDTVAERYPVGSKVHGVVSETANFGVFVRIEDGIEGLVHITQLGISKDQDHREFFKVGAEVDSQVTGVDRESRRLSLSISALTPKGDRNNDVSSFVPDDGAMVTFKDLIEAKK